MSYEALQQAILQRPQMVLQGLAGARDQAREAQLAKIMQSQNISQGILQAMGLYVDQQRFGQQMDFAKEGQAFEQKMATEQGGREDKRLRIAEEQSGLDAALKMGNIEEAKIRNANLQALLSGQIEGQGLQNRATTQGMEQSAMLFPGQLTGQRQGLQMGEEQILGAAQQRQQGAEMHPLQMQGAQQGLEAGAVDLESKRREADWSKRFSGAKTDEERFQIIGENPDAYLRMWETGQQVGARDAAAAAKVVAPQDYALEELRKLHSRYQQMGVVGAEGMMASVLELPQQEKARSASSALMGLMNQVRTGQIQPMEGESTEAFLGRVLSMLDMAGGAATNGPAPTTRPTSTGNAEADDPFGIGG